MNKNIIRNHLINRFISEEATPGISVTNKAKKESGKINKDGVADIGKEITAYEKAIKREPKESSKMAPNKFNYVDDNEKTYHDEMETLNGMEMLEYNSEPGAGFKEKAEEAIVGSSRMGNAIGGNAEETWGASSDNFGKDLVKRIKNSSEKRAAAEIQTYGMGDVQIPTGRKVQTAITAVSAGKAKGDTTKIPASASEKTKIKTVKENNITNNKTQIKESMKRLTFKKEFDGVNTTQKIGHALTLIPEGYKTNNKEFELTDGNVTCRVRWEGNLTEGKAVVVQAANKSLISEDMDRMKALMGYKSQDTLGLVKGKSRVDENAAFGDIWKKTKKLLGESDEIEDADAVEGSAESLDSAVNVAPEAKKHVKGSVSTDDGTQAPAPKKGEWEKINVNHAADAKKHIEGSVAEDKKTAAPSPKEGNWEEIKKKSADSTKAVESGKPTNIATDKPKTVAPSKSVNENIEDESDDDDEPEVEDTFNKVDIDDDNTDAEPSANDISSEVPPAIDAVDDEDDTAVVAPAPSKGPKLMKSPSNPGKLYFMVGNTPMEIPEKFHELARTNPNIALTKMQDMEDDIETDDEQELDEYGNEHPISVADADAQLKGIKK